MGGDCGELTFERSPLVSLLGFLLILCAAVAVTGMLAGSSLMLDVVDTLARLLLLSDG